MNFDTSKENIQPLRGGRNAIQLEVALHAQSSMEVQREVAQQKEEFERQIRAYTGDDPLDNWYSYISWIEQTYPKHGHEGNLVPLLDFCVKTFERDERYRNDPRLCRILIKFIDLQSNPLELFHMMHASGLCRGCTDMYKAWAYYYEAVGNFQGAHDVFEIGKKDLAQPYEDLIIAHKNLMMAAGQHMLSGRGTDQSILSEKRHALTSLKTYKPGKVGSVRNVAPGGTGTFGAPSSSFRNAQVPVYEDRGDQRMGGTAAPPISILAAAKRQEVPKENLLKPGPWTKASSKTKPSTGKPLGFAVREDSIDGEESLNTSFVNSTKETYSDWIVSLTLPDPTDPTKIPMYPKNRVYAEVTTEYSIEELRCLRYKSRLVVSTLETHQAVQGIVDDVILMDSSNCSEKESYSSKPFGHTDLNTQSFGTPVNLKGSIRNQFGQNDSKMPCFISPLMYSPVNSHAILKTPNMEGTEDSPMAVAQSAKFAIYEQSNQSIQEQNEPKGSAMKTPFKDLNAELAETGSRGGMDVAAAAPIDSAARVVPYDEDSSSSYNNNYADLSCNTQLFNFDLNAMKVSTPLSKQVVVLGDEAMKTTRKQLFGGIEMKDATEQNVVLSTILEETNPYTFGCSSSGATTKSSLSGQTKPHMDTIPDENSGYLVQNLMANAALRTSLLGDLMDYNQEVITIKDDDDDDDDNEDEPIEEVAQELNLDVRPLNILPSDPFKHALIEELLKRVHFPARYIHNYITLANIQRLFVRKETFTIGLDKYLIEKELGKGTYGIVFRCIDMKTGGNVALKYQKPPNKWEFYICRELQNRLKNHNMKDRFMDVQKGYFSPQASVLISDFMPCGSLLNVANLVKQKSGRPMKESLCIYFCLEMLRVVQIMHEVQIIHADIKPDNFLVQLCANDSVTLQLIDFGCSIDMSLLPTGASFTRKVTTENFICCEMLDGRRWNYHTDMFCVAATAHVLLFEKYIQLQKREGLWSISHRLPRYARVDLWNMFFSTLLNQQEGPAESRGLQEMLDDSLSHKFDDYHSDMRYLCNILKNR